MMSEGERQSMTPRCTVPGGFPSHPDAYAAYPCHQKGLPCTVKVWWASTRHARRERGMACMTKNACPPLPCFSAACWPPSIWACYFHQYHRPYPSTTCPITSLRQAVDCCPRLWPSLFPPFAPAPPPSTPHAIHTDPLAANKQPMPRRRAGHACLCCRLGHATRTLPLHRTRRQACP